MIRNPSRRTQEILGLIRSRSAFVKKPGFRRVALVVATLLFAGGLWLAHRARPGLFDDIAIDAWLMVVGLVLVTICMNALVFLITARVGSVRMNTGRALVVTIMSTAANLLPLPGGAAVRTIALASDGIGYKRAVALTLLVGMAWLGIAAAIASAGFFFLELHVYGFIAALLASVGATIALSGLRGFNNADVIHLGALASAQFGLAITGGLRLYFCFQALGEVAAFDQILVLLFAPVASAFVGTAPAGLGLTELTAAGLAALVGVAPAAAFVAAALNRITGLMVITPIALLMNFLVNPQALGNDSHDRGTGQGK